jgi:hypothetical protein
MMMTKAFQPTGVEEVETETMRRLKVSRTEHYLRGPIRIDDIRAATKLGGSCLALLLLIHFRRTVTGQSEVTLPNGFLAEFEIDKSAKQRGLKRLEEAKLITVERAAGHSVTIELRSARNRRGARKRNQRRRRPREANVMLDRAGNINAPPRRQ